MPKNKGNTSTAALPLLSRAGLLHALAGSISAYTEVSSPSDFAQKCDVVDSYSSL